MKTLKKIKLNSLEEKQLKETDLTGLLGGACSCGCVGTSTSESNKKANISGNLTTPGYSACDSIFSSFTVTWH